MNKKEIENEIDKIIQGIGSPYSPYGEGVTYSKRESYDRERDGKITHLDETEEEEMKIDIKTIIFKAQRDAIKKYTTWLIDNGYCDTDVIDKGGLVEYLTSFRKEQDE